MKKYLIVISLIAIMCSSLMAAKGGVAPFLASCCLGPRIGLEMNEGSKIQVTEWINAFIFPIIPFQAAMGESMADVNYMGAPRVIARNKKSDGGIVPFLAGCCLGPRVGLEMNDGRGVRNLELFMLIPAVGFIPRVMIAAEAYQGKTMSSIAATEKI